ncbi:hypothetical protein [Salmonella phage S19cd]|uniref:Tail fiber protein n=1 Tax=Salmonella phage S19cd TaxID=2834971 RepID=A0A8E7BYL4_9CAUD|nr:hypothetical protein [Salmonella phage S19cd]
MADYKLSQLNSIDTIRSEDLLHIRVKKRPEMLGDEDRRMTYQDFLASFKLERFVQIAGSTMIGDLGIVKLLYGGNVVFDPTGSSEITIGDILKTFKINSSGLKLTIADASRSATVYHTLNKPSPNELGMRTNEENDARYARLAVANTFSGTQNIQGDANLLRLRNQNAKNAQYIEGVDLDGSARWWVGIGSNGSDEVKLYNNKYNSFLTVASNISVNKSLAITGQVQPSDFSNLDARYFTQTVANQRFAQLAGDNTFRGANTFSRNLTIISDGAALMLKNATTRSLYIQCVDSQNTNKWYVGNGDDTASVLLLNYVYGSNIRLDNGYVSVNQNFRITGQVQPSDFSNLDARFLKVSGNTVASLIIDSTNHGAMTGKVISIPTRADWNKPQGFTAMTQVPDSSVIPNFPASSFAYLHVFAKRDTGGGQLAFLANHSAKGIWLARSLTSTDTVTFEKIYTDGTKPTPSELGAYTKAETDQKIAKAISDSTDLNKIYPVGIVTWFNSNVNPNTALPGLTWTYLNNGVGRTIRIASANGSDVATTGGSDSVTLSVGNLPSHTHSFSATTSSFDYGTKSTNNTGAHTHSVSGTAASSGNHYHTYIGDDSLYNRKLATRDSKVNWDCGDGTGSGGNYRTSTSGAHTHSVSGTAASSGAHAHTVGIGAHSHTVSGKTGGTGSGSAFSVTNQFYKLMAWVRTA